MEIHPPASDGVGSAQTDGGAAHDAAGGEARAQRLAAAQGQQRIQARPGGRHARAARRVPGQVEVAGEEKGGREEEQG